MSIKTFEDYNKEIKPLLAMASFEDIIRYCKSKYNIEIYAPSKASYDGHNNPILLVKFPYNCNLYEIPFRCLIDANKEKEIMKGKKHIIDKIDYGIFNYIDCKLLQKVQKY